MNNKNTIIGLVLIFGIFIGIQLPDDPIQERAGDPEEEL